MPTYQLLTDRTLAQASAITPTTLIHIVYTGDPSQNPAGSSYKAELGQLVGLFSGDPLENNLFVEIIASDVTTLTANVSGGVPPYSYEWKFSDQINGTDPSDPLNHYFEFTTPTTLQDVEWTPIFSSSFSEPRFGSTTDTGYIGLVKVIVTDSIGRKVSDTYFLIAYNAS